MSSKCRGAIVALSMVVVAAPCFAQHGPRELQLGIVIGAVIPGGDWSEQMENGYGFGADIGLRLSPRTSAGFHFGVQSLATKLSRIPPIGAHVDGEHWGRYSAAVFGEHELRGSGIVPFVGGNLGMHFTYIRFNEVVAGFDSQGDHGFGYALVCGVRHQLGRRLAVEVRGQLENTPKLTSGSFYSIGAGLSMWF